MKKSYSLYTLILLSNLLFSCSPKISFIGTLTNTDSDSIPRIFEISKPDGAFQIVQTGENSYMWLATNGIPTQGIENGKFYTKANIKELTSNTEQPIKGSEPQYFEHGNYRIVRMISSGTMWDYFYLFREFEKVKNANSLKFSIYPEEDNIVYLFSYRK